MTTILSIILLLVAAGVLVFIARELETTKQQKLTGIILLLLCILFFVSELSFLFYPTDNSRNFAGLVGYYSSFFLFWLTGIYFLVIPTVLGLLGYLYLTMSESKDKNYLLFFIPAGIIINTVLALFLRFEIATIPSGGVLGTIISKFLINYFGALGTYLILGFSIIIMCFMMVKEKIFHQPLRIETEPTIEKIKKVKSKKEPKPKPEQNAGAPEGPKEELEPIPEIDLRTEFLNILQTPAKKYGVDEEIIKKEAELLTNRLAEFDVTGKVVAVESGPVISRFEFEPAPGIKVNRISSLNNDLALALKATRIRIVAPIPGKSAVGIEVPNRERGLVYLRNGLLDSDFDNNPSPLAIVLGEDITGKPVSYDIATMPHMLIAGTTGSGKSVFINTIMISLLYHTTHKDVRFLTIDPKRLELPMYNPIPYLLRTAITEPKDAVHELERLVTIMEMRYRDFAREGVRDIDGYNEKVRKKRGEIKPYILIIVDELADLMLTAPSEIEENITRLAQMSRAVGIHLILATQRPSVDVITGLIKANFPCRIAFQVASKTDSRTILDMNGAESLLGRGDMLFLPPGKGSPVRLHGPYVSTDEVGNISKLIARQYLIDILKGAPGDLMEITNSIIDEELWTVFTDRQDPAFDEKRRALANLISIEKIDEIIQSGYYPKLPELTGEERPVDTEVIKEVDPMFPEAARLVFRHQVASVSLLQRRLNLGYARAGRIIDQLEAAGIVQPFQGSKSRNVLVTKEEDLEATLRKFS